MNFDTFIKELKEEMFKSEKILYLRTEDKQGVFDIIDTLTQKYKDDTAYHFDCNTDLEKGCGKEITYDYLDEQTSMKKTMGCGKIITNWKGKRCNVQCGDRNLMKTKEYFLCNECRRNKK